MAAADPTDDEDRDLLARARDGDDVAYGELLRRHQRSALRVAAVICGSTEEASDIVQDAFIRAHGNLGSYRGDGSVRSWMLRVVANQAKNHLRGQARRRRRDEAHARLAVRSIESADQTAERRMEHEHVAAALGRLARQDREVLGCRFVAGLGESETAEVLGIPTGTVKSRTSRALDRLARELSPPGDPTGVGVR
jgi:RNA polymerase sigma-70 factor (ECF subfamily)